MPNPPQQWIDHVQSQRHKATRDLLRVALWALSVALCSVVLLLYLVIDTSVTIHQHQIDRAVRFCSTATIDYVRLYRNEMKVMCVDGSTYTFYVGRPPD